VALAEENYLAFHAKVKAHEKVIEDYCRRDRELAQNFKGHFQNLEPDAISALQKLFRQRNSAEGGGGKKGTLFFSVVFLGLKEGWMLLTRYVTRCSASFGARPRAF